MEENMPTIKHIVKVVGVSALIIVILAFCGDNMRNNNSYKGDKCIACYIYSQDLVKKKLKSPKSADFPLYNKSFATDKGDTVLISAYVDANNSFGTSVRVYYTANIKVKDGEPVSGTATLIE